MSSDTASRKDEHTLQGGRHCVNDTKIYLKQFTLGSLIKKYATPPHFLKWTRSSTSAVP